MTQIAARVPRNSLGWEKLLSGLQESCFPEGEVIVTARASDDDVVGHLDLEKLRCFPDPLCEPLVRLARRRFAGWMVVHHDQAICRCRDDRAKDLARVGDALIQ